MGNSNIGSPQPPPAPKRPYCHHLHMFYSALYTDTKEFYFYLHGKTL